MSVTITKLSKNRFYFLSMCVLSFFLLSLDTPEKPEAEKSNPESLAKPAIFQPVSMDFRGASLSEVIRTLTMENKANFIFPDQIGSQKINLSLKNVPWNEALEAVLQTYGLGIKKLPGNVIRIDAVGNLEGSEQSIKQVRQQAILSKATKVLVVRLSYSKAEKMSKIVEDMLVSKKFDERTRVQSDERTNSLIVESIPEELEKIQALIERIDLQTPQVKINTRIIEIIKDVDKFFGINWGMPVKVDQGRGLGFGNLIFPNNMISSFSVDSNAQSRVRGGKFDTHFGSISNMIELDLRLRMAELSDYTRNLQNSSVLVLDNEKAVIEAGTVDYFLVPTGQGQNQMTQVEYKLNLTVTPHITPDGAVQMKIDLGSDNPLDNRGEARASKSTRKLETTMLRKTGETAVIGGIYTTALVESQQGIPYVSKIPILGALFRSKGVAENKRELMIMVTPEVINVQKAFSLKGSDKENAEQNNITDSGPDIKSVSNNQMLKDNISKNDISSNISSNNKNVEDHVGQANDSKNTNDKNISNNLKNNNNIKNNKIKNNDEDDINSQESNFDKKSDSSQDLNSNDADDKDDLGVNENISDDKKDESENNL